VLTNGNREEAARILGVGARTVYRKLKEFEL
jgi:two-component system response regulator HydG